MYCSIAALFFSSTTRTEFSLVSFVSIIGGVETRTILRASETRGIHAFVGEGGSQTGVNLVKLQKKLPR